MIVVAASTQMAALHSINEKAQRQLLLLLCRGTVSTGSAGAPTLGTSARLLLFPFAPPLVTKADGSTTVAGLSGINGSRTVVKNAALSRALPLMSHLEAQTFFTTRSSQRLIFNNQDCRQLEDRTLLHKDSEHLWNPEDWTQIVR